MGAVQFGQKARFIEPHNGECALALGLALLVWDVGVFQQVGIAGE